MPAETPAQPPRQLPRWLSELLRQIEGLMPLERQAFAAANAEVLIQVAGHYAEALAAADPARRQQTPQWVPVGEGPPPEGVEVQLLCDHGIPGLKHPLFRDVARRDGDGWYSLVYSCRRTKGVTHWAPLLSVPGEGDAPPRPPQGRQPQPSFQDAADIEAETTITAGSMPAQTPAPTLTTRDVEVIRLARLGMSMGDELLAIIDRCLLAAGAPTAGTATAVNRLKYAEQFLVAYDRATPGSGWKTLGLRGYRRLKEILFAADPEFGRDMDCAEPGADAAPAAEGGGE